MMKTKTASSARSALLAALKAYNGGDTGPLEKVFTRLRQEIANDHKKHDGLLRALVRGLLKDKDVWLLRKILALPGDTNYSREIVLAANLNWKEGYDLLRQTHFDLPIEELTLFSAFKMNDPSAYYDPGTESFQLQVVKDFLDEVRDWGMPNDDAIAFLEEVGLTWAVDFGLGLKGEWGEPRSI